MSFSSGGGHSQSWLPGSAEPIGQNLEPMIGEWLNQYQSQGGMTGTQPLETAATNTLQQTVSGQNVNPNTNPIVQQAEQGVTDQASNYLQRNLANLNSNANQQGQLFSTKNNQVQSEAAGDSAAQVADTLAQMNLNQYNTGVQNQLEAVQPSLTQAQYPYTQALNIAQILGGMGSGSNSSVSFGF